MQLPVLGALFKSRDFINRQTELVVLVTPYVVRAVAQKHLSRPDDGFADASDPATILLGRLNRIYGVRRAGGQQDAPIAAITVSFSTEAAAWESDDECIPFQACNADRCGAARCW